MFTSLDLPDLLSIDVVRRNLAIIISVRYLGVRSVSRVILISISEIQLVVYYQCLVLIG